MVRSLGHLEGPLLPVLHALQDRYGYIDEDAMRLVSAELNLSRAEVYGVVSFYHDFRMAPGPVHQVKLCRAEACQARGGDGIALCFENKLGVRLGEPAVGDVVSLEACYCLGLCAIGPNAIIDGALVARLDEAKVAKLAAELG
nr:NAD(P)H-dependent oxidoreductase subunit E [Aureimonas jatrophae]